MVVNTKYSIGMDVWMIYSNKAKNFLVNGEFINVTPDGVEISYILKSLGDAKFDENLLYPTKEELLKNL